MHSLQHEKTRPEFAKVGLAGGGGDVAVCVAFHRPFQALQGRRKFASTDGCFVGFTAARSHEVDHFVGAYFHLGQIAIDLTRLINRQGKLRVHTQENLSHY